MYMENKDISYYVESDTAQKEADYIRVKKAQAGVSDNVVQATKVETDRE